MEYNSRSLILSILEREIAGKIPWTLDFGACKGIQWELSLKYKDFFKINSSLPTYFNYDILMALDPDRVHNDKTDYLSSEFKNKILPRNLIGGVPLSKKENFDYTAFYENLPKGGFFDSFGLYYYPWGKNEEYFTFLSPLENTDDFKTIEEYPLPDIDKEDFFYFKKDIEFIKSNNKICAAYSGSIYEWTYYLRGREKIYYDFYDNPKIIEMIINKVFYFVKKLTVENINAGVDILCFFDDLGAQAGLQISPQIFRKYFKSRYKKIWTEIKNSHKKYIFLHSCGNIEEIIPDLIECGLDILHPIQPETMDIYKLAKKYNKDIVFWGTMSNQKTFPFGSKIDIYNEVKHRIKNIGKKVPLILGSSNTLGKDIPLENIKYFADACLKYCGI